MKKKGSNRKIQTEIETASFLEGLAEELREKMAGAGGTAECVLDDGLPGKLRLDSGFIKETFSFLFSHCAEHTLEKTSTLFVRGAYLEEGRYMLRLSVSEEGEGFTDEELELLDERKNLCQKADLSRLYTIGKSAEEREGSFSVYSVSGGGAVFYLVLPCEVLTTVTVRELKEKGLHNISEGEKAAKEKSEAERTEEEQPVSGWIDRKLALNYAGDMEEMRLELLDIYFEQAQQYLKELPELLKAEDWEKYRIVVHAIKGNSLGIGAEGFSKEAYGQEMAARDGDIEKIKAEFPVFYGHYQSLVEEVRKSRR